MNIREGVIPRWWPDWFFRIFLTIYDRFPRLFPSYVDNPDEDN